MRNNDIHVNDLRYLDPYFMVFSTDECGSIDSRPADHIERKFFVRDCEGEVVTVDMPWADAAWIAAALNAWADRDTSK